jgi:hypothetical protein
VSPPASLPTVTVATTSLGLGTTVLELVVDDGTADPVVAPVTVVVVDTTAPSLAISCSPTSLWPPNHKMVTVEVDVSSWDLSGPVMITAAAESDEADNGLGDGDQPNDIQNLAVDADTGDVTVNLRAERSGAGDGRTYTITVKARDGSSNVTTRICEVVVPKSQGN